jgi:hypothetical protein
MVQAGMPEEWQLLLIAGQRDQTEMWRQLGWRKGLRVVPYLDDPRPAYAAADIVVSRAGASTIGELAATGTPALLVPYPHATANHQMLNAQAYVEGGAARIIPDEELDPGRLRLELTAALGSERAASDARGRGAGGAYGPASGDRGTGEELVGCERGQPVRFSSGAGAGTVHFIGISGIGMSALARILMQRGYRVTGSSDRRTPLTDRLREEGAVVTVGHAPSNLGDAATVVISTAIARDNRELVAAHERKLEVVHRGALLAHLMSDRRGIAIAGTHGKTTTTAMTARRSKRAASIRRSSSAASASIRRPTHATARVRGWSARPTSRISRSWNCAPRSRSLPTSRTITSPRMPNCRADRGLRALHGQRAGPGSR